MSEANLSSKKKRVLRRRSGSKFRLQTKKIILFGLIGLVAWLTMGQLRGVILHQLASIHEVEFGALEKELLVEGALLAREETVLFAPVSGTVTPLAPEGERVSEGEVVARIQGSHGGAQGIKASRSGIVCYHTDGLESVLSPDLTDTLNLSAIELPKHSLKEVGSGAQVERGQPVLKIVNNLRPTLIWLEFDVGHFEVFPNQGGNLRFRIGEQEYQAILAKLETQGVQARAILELSRGNLFHERELSINIILERVEGLKIPNEALVSMDETQGVYKALTKGYRWVPLTILIQDQEYSIVEGLSRGDRILTNPGLIRENPAQI